jgi:hypothetical protein
MDNTNNKWTIEALKEHYDDILKEYNNVTKERDEKINQHFESLQVAVNKAENATEKRFESVNEFRNTLTDQQRTFMPRSETEIMFKNHEVLHESLTLKIDDVSKKLEKIVNMKQGGNVVWAYIISIISLIGVIISIAINLSRT